MCHDHDSRPPAPPRTGEVRERGVLTLTSADGTEFSAAFAAFQCTSKRTSDGWYRRIGVPSVVITQSSWSAS